MLNIEAINDLKQHVVIEFDPFINGDPNMPRSLNRSKLAHSSLFLRYEGSLRFRIIKSRYSLDHCPLCIKLNSLFPSMIRIAMMEIKIDAEDFALLKLFW